VWQFLLKKNNPMKIATTLFIYTILLCMAVRGVIAPEICIGTDLCHPQIEWADYCHERHENPHDAHASALAHQEKECVDILIPLTAGTTINPSAKTPLFMKKPVIIKCAEGDRLFFAFHFSKAKRTLQPVFTDIIPLSIAATVLIV
jgi:hypothetical protein